MGFFQAKIPLLLKPLVRVFGVFASLDHASSLVTTPHDVTDSSAYPCIGNVYDADGAVFEISQPSLQDRVDLADDVRNTATSSTWEFLTQFIAQLLAAFVPGPFKLAKATQKHLPQRNYRILDWRNLCLNPYTALLLGRYCLFVS